MSEIWKGEASEPTELANEVANALSHVQRLPGVEAIELVTVTMSSANRDLIVSALRNFADYQTVWPPKASMKM